MQTLSKLQFEKLCLIELNRIYEQGHHPSWLFWLDKNNKLQTADYLSLLGSNFVKSKTWENIKNIQRRKDFQCWLFQEWQEPCLI